MISLTIDIGNHRTKIELWDNSNCFSSTVKDNIPEKEILEYCKERKPEGIIISSVRKDSGHLLDCLIKEIGGLIVDFNNTEIKKYYSEKIEYKGNIGPDRIAAYLGAKRVTEKSSILIIDAGTAITLDVTDQNGVFYGGNISLGIHQRISSLASATSLLPEIEVSEYESPFGKDTVSAIEAGVKNSVAGELAYTYEKAQRFFKTEKIVITGGDRNLIYELMGPLKDKCIIDPYLVGRGLNYHLQEHYFRTH